MKRKIIITLFIPTMILTSCHKQEDVPSFSGSEIITVSPATCVTTKAPVDGKVFPDGRTFVMSASVNGSSTDYFKDAVFGNDGSVWKSDKYWPATGSLDFLALSCDTLSVGDISWASRAADTLTVSVPDNSSAQCDILHASAQGQSRSESGTPMTFRHTGSVVIYTAYSTVPYDSATNQGVTIRKITLKNAKHSGNLKVSAVSEAGDYCTWSSLGSQKDVALLNAGGSENLGYNVPTTPMDITAEGNHFGIGGKGIMVPEQMQTSFEVAYTMHSGKDASGKALDTDLTFIYACAGDWDEGKKYNYKIGFTLNDITVNPTVTDWSTVEEDVPFPEPVAAIYAINGATSVSLPTGVMAANSIISVDWGDGSKEAFTNTTNNTLKLSHTYASEFTGSVKLNARKGKLTFNDTGLKEYRKFLIIDFNKISANPFRGAQILHINGNTYTTEQWTDSSYTASEALGVAVCNGTHSLLLNKARGWAKWSSNITYLIDGVVTADNRTVAEKDFSGKSNTNAILAAKENGLISDCPAVDWCKSLGPEWYLPAAGEVLMIFSYRSNVNKCLVLIEGTEIYTDTYHYWTSTQYKKEYAWAYYTQTSSSGYNEAYYKNSNTAVFGVTDL